MLKLSANPTFRHEVTINTPVDGGHKTETVHVTYNVIPVSEVAKHDIRTTEGTASFLKVAVSKIDDIEDESGKAVPWNDELRDRLFNLPYIRQGLMRGYVEAVDKASSGN